MKYWANRQVLTVITVFLLVSHCVTAETQIHRIHFLIPGGAGGGWDGTARGVGEALTKSNLIKRASYQNMSGGGGGRAIAHLVKTAKRQQDTLMVNSTPIIIRSLQKIFSHSFQDLTPIAAVVADYGVFTVVNNSEIQNWQQAVTLFQNDPSQLTVGGGSGRGSMDHLVAALAFQAARGDPKQVRYIPYDAGGKAMAGLLSGETKILSTGLGEALAQHRSGQIRILAITASERSPAVPNVPTFKELGYEIIFINWRGFFGPPDLSQEKVKTYTKVLEKMFQTPDWETVRMRNGWENLYISGKKFHAFLIQQESTISRLMKELGFLE
ncbi:TPA: tripartite tricarboxylate transporter substrate binding protein [Candidatus Poribacteria bacterium]|nr:tripartite tricarboxylate transporter substrate binding protein [Candidatus Poribacteria bacterium]HIA66227.1 tripartite tricarboxylate transporter substrate binding protein [Candidatus Poribacteria bacterium]HIB88706.1 tripartite tricarboxylate transporter substrate binding protein [Candidatus Poribacteria bacterium]HIC03501.1 tripartite tricarboxylate transporter substrate binding protein [Candidatus Poribacteria bacterium]HIN28649.1 tripartite tricarboxylate transporter substrate binding 